MHGLEIFLTRAVSRAQGEASLRRAEVRAALRDGLDAKDDKTMSWAKAAIAKLRDGQVAQCRPHGGSMRGRIESGQLVTLDPKPDPAVDDAVLCRCNGNVYLHLIKATQGHGEKRRYLIGNNRGGINGWVGRAAIYGVVIAVDD